MKQIRIIPILLVLLLAFGTDCPAQKRQVIHALTGKGVKDLYNATQYKPQMPPLPRITPAPPSIVALPDTARLRALQETSQTRLRSLRLPDPKTIYRKAQEQVREFYRLRCADMEAGKTPRDTLAWVRLGNRAARLDLDDVAADCMNRFLYYRPSAAKITRAVDSLMYASQRYARPMIETAAEREVYAYWQDPDAHDARIPDLRMLTALGERYGCRTTDLARGTLSCIDGDYGEAGRRISAEIARAAKDPETPDEYSRLLCGIAAHCMIQAGQHAELLCLFETYDAAEQYAAKDPALAFQLYRAALLADPQKARKYADMGLAADEAYFTEQFEAFYDTVYNQFVSRPQPLSNLDFLLGSPTTEQYLRSALNLAADLLAQLPDTDIYDGREHFHDEGLAPYRDALLEIARRSESATQGRLTPDHALLLLIAESTRGNFARSAEEGRARVKELFERLYTEERDNDEYTQVIVLSGFCHSLGLSVRDPKGALKVMTGKVMPLFEQLVERDPNPLGTDATNEVYGYMASLYRRTGKNGKAEKMERLIVKPATDGIR